jgi:hypothetical protein
VSPDVLSISNPSPFQKLSTQPTVQPHAPHTTAEKHRRRAEFHRTTVPFYTPGVWASGAYCEKANTAFFKVPVEDMQEAVAKDLSEEEAERALAAKLKEVSGMWVVRMWIKHVATQERYRGFCSEFWAKIARGQERVGALRDSLQRFVEWYVEIPSTARIQELQRNERAAREDQERLEERVEALEEERDRLVRERDVEEERRREEMDRMGRERDEEHEGERAEREARRREGM